MNNLANLEKKDAYLSFLFIQQLVLTTPIYVVNKVPQFSRSEKETFLKYQLAKQLPRIRACLLSGETCSNCLDLGQKNVTFHHKVTYCFPEISIECFPSSAQGYFQSET